MRIAAWGALLTFLVNATIASAIDLYDGSAGTAPETQGWLAFASLGGTPVRTTAGGKTTLDTTSANAIFAGYSNYFGSSTVNPAFPALSRSDGFVVSLDMRVLSESHANANRAGVSLIALASDLQGIEVAFWTNEIWVQSGPDFLHGEGAAFNTTAAITTYDLTIHGSTYSINANGNPILSGNLRNYSSFGLPYNLPNFMFLGDDTTSASASFEFSRLSVVPEPAVGLILIVLYVGARRRGDRVRRLSLS
jgi:hypothetical protein